MKKNFYHALIAIVIVTEFCLMAINVPAMKANTYISPDNWKPVRVDHPKNPGVHGTDRDNEGRGIMRYDNRSRNLVITPEIEELARGLKNDPRLMYEYVRNTIHYEPHPGLQRGPTMTLLDRRGGDLEQAALLVALFRASGYTAHFIQGDIQLTAEQVTNWLGTPDDAWLVESIFSYGGYIGYYVPGSGGLIDYARVEHYWVRVNIDGVDYDFDPSFKAYEDIAGIDLAAAMAYDKLSFIFAAMAGMTQTSYSLTNMNRTNIRSKLETYCSNLKNHIVTSDPDASLEDIISGRRIIPVRNQPFQTSLPYVVEEEFVYEMPPYDEKGLLHLMYYSYIFPQQGDFEIFLSTHEIVGSRITLYTTPGTPYPTIHVLVDGVEVASGLYTDDNELGILVNHGYMGGEATYADQIVWTKVEPDTFYTFIHGWYHTGRHIIEKRRKILDSYLDQGLAHDSEAVLGESLHIIGLNWLAECSSACLINDAVSRSLTIRHHDFGWIASKDTVFMDTPLTGSSVLNLDNWTGSIPPAFFVEAGLKSALEWAVIDQLQPYSAVSTIKLLDQACAGGQTIYSADYINFTDDVLPHLTDYTPEDLVTIQGYIDEYYQLVLPENGDITDGCFTGVGYYALYYDSYIQTLISGGLSGGYGTEFADCDPNAANGQKRYDNADEHVKSNEPVDLVTGYYLDTETDLDVGRGEFPFRLPFTRSYSSGNRQHDTGLGNGWNFNWNGTSRRVSDGFPVLGGRTAMDAIPAIAAIFVTGDVFSDGVTLEPVVATTMIHRWLVEQLLDNVVTVQVMDQTWQFVELPDGSWVNPGEQRTTLTLQADDSSTMISDTGTLFNFDPDGRLVEIEDANGNTVSLTYTGNLLTRIANGMTRSLAFTYTGTDRIETITDGNGRTVTFTYDGDGNLTHVMDPENHSTEYIYDIPGRMTRIYTPSNPLNSWVYNEYDALDRVIRQTDIMGNSYAYFYGGNRIEEIDPRSHCHVVYLNEDGRVVEAIDQEGLSTIFEYDGLNRIRRVEHPEGNGQEFEYDGMFRKISTLRLTPKTGSSEEPREYVYTYDPVSHRRLTATDPRGDTTTYSYDANGNIILIELPEILSVTPEYHFEVNSRGQVTRIENPEGHVMTFAYDSVTGDPENAITDAGGLNQTISFDYNAIGTLTSISDPMGHQWIYTYDANRHMTGITAPSPFSYQTLLGYDSDGNVQSISRQTDVPANPWQTLTVEYDLGNRFMRITDDENRMMKLEFDDRRDLWKVYDELLQNTEALYDARGNAWRMLDEESVIKEEHAYSNNGRKTSVTDANMHTTLFEYDSFDRLRRKIYPDTRWLEYTYDDSCFLTGITTRSGNTITIGYNELAQLSSKTYPDMSQITYEYDLLGQMTSVSNASGTINYEYDTLNRLVATILPGSFLFTYQYDLNNNLTRITYPDGYFVTYEYDSLNRLEKIYENGTDLLVDYEYDSLSRRISTSCSNSVIETYTYDNANQVKMMSYGFTSGSVLFEYDYDPNGNIHRVDVDNPAFEYSPGAASTDIFTVNMLNQYVTVNSTAFTYTTEGCLQSDSEWTYGYDYENLLVSANNGTDAITYTYDGLKRRVTKTVNGTETRYLYDSFNLRELRDGTNTLLVRYIYEPGLDNVVMMKTGSGDYFCHRDKQGSVIALSNATGAAVETYTYSPYGSPANASMLGNVLMYCGSVYDLETGLYSMRARYYSPAVGRFLSPDPLGFNGGGLNMYTYAMNNPVRFTDSMGLYANIGGGYQDNYNEMIADLYESDNAEDHARAKELDIIQKSLDDYGKWQESLIDKGGNCVVTWVMYLDNGFYEAVRNLKYYDVREIAGGYIVKEEKFGHFGIAITPKNCTDFDKVIAIYDPIGHSYFNPGGQYDCADRQWDENAWRDPKAWKNIVLPYNYMSGGVYMGDHSILLHKPVVPGDEFLGKTYQLPENYTPMYDIYKSN
ncbi:hypothetical protein JXA80_03170 [bacterium]|nr:hypothetical protein [candidate division CSSED10-310 bacterium]